MPKKCCVKGCKAKGQSMHRFPNPHMDADLFFEWMTILGLANFKMKTPSQIYNNLRVCFAHFAPSCKGPGERTLHRHAIPTIGIPAHEPDLTAPFYVMIGGPTVEQTESLD
ncbi:hypothetical protein CBL_13448 [Carabus blaptoides fortunei]